MGRAAAKELTAGETSIIELSEHMHSLHKDNVGIGVSVCVWGSSAGRVCGGGIPQVALTQDTGYAKLKRGEKLVSNVEWDLLKFMQHFNNPV